MSVCYTVCVQHTFNVHTKTCKVMYDTILTVYFCKAVCSYNIQMTKMYTQYIMSHNAMYSNWPFIYIVD